MLVLLLAYSLAQSSFGEAGPIPSLIESRDLSASDQENNRTLWTITWSCLTTIFLCTWVTVHPNIAFRPEKRNMGWFEEWISHPFHGFLSHKLPLFLWALFVPEYILAWSIRQYLNAGAIQRKVDGWTRAHGFFMIMGGFHLFRLPDDASSVPLKSSSQYVNPSDRHSRQNAVPVRPLQMDDIPVDILDIVAPTEAELRDKAKSDGLTKLIVLVQTSWFVIQCIARGVDRLPLTELEIVTLAYAMMNLFIYVFWWDKPRNVQCPIRVYKSSAAIQEKDEKVDTWDDGWIKGSIERIGSYSLGTQDKFVNLNNLTAVPMFWSGRPGDAHLFESSMGPSFLGAAFGAIHFIAWSSEFPSRAELILWRVSCIAMTAIPLLAGLACVLLRFDPNDDDDWNEEAPIFVIAMSLVVILALVSWLYVAARIATLVIAFATLRSLPPSAFSVVDWTTFIPHI